LFFIVLFFFFSVLSAVVEVLARRVVLRIIAMQKEMSAIIRGQLAIMQGFFV
jgi:hypothetical protein